MVHSECTECNKMELPDDVIGDIRKFAKPAFSHWKVFKEAESVIEPRHLKRLREELQGPNAAQVCETLKTYLNDLRRQYFRATQNDRSRLGWNRNTQQRANERSSTI